MRIRIRRQIDDRNTGNDQSYSYDDRQTISEIKSYLVNTDIPVKAIK